jgi:Tfp pilus assembly protein PilF
MIAAIAAALAALTVAVFAPVRHFAFVTWDDLDYITKNPHVTQGLTAASMRWALTTGYGFYWHPLTWWSHQLDVQLFGLDAGGHHLTSLVWHAIGAALLFLVLRRYTGAVGRSAVVAALFAVHPLHVESVAWISERKDVLSTCAWLLTVAAYWRYAQAPSRGRYAIVALLYALALMSKPMVVTLPVVLLLIDAWPLGRVPCDRLRWRDWWPLILEKLPLAAMAVIVGVITFIAQEDVGAVGGLAALPISYRVATAIVSYVVYLRQMLWPAGLAAYYPYPHDLPDWWIIGLAAAILAGISYAVFRRSARARTPYLAVGWAWYLVMLAPVIGFVQTGDQVRADRFTYLPLVGVFIAIVWGVADLLRRVGAPRAIAPALAAIAIVPCAVIARADVAYWQDGTTMWTRDLAVAGENYRAHAGLAEAASVAGRTAEAIAEYEAAIRLVPDVADTHNDFGVALTNAGQLDRAAVEYATAIRLAPRMAEAHNNLGAILARQQRADDALDEYNAALAIDPSYALARHNRALALAAKGQLDAAITDALQAIRENPRDAQWRLETATLLTRRGDTPGAIAQLEQAVALDPSLTEAQRALRVLRGQ